MKTLTKLYSVARQAILRLPRSWRWPMTVITGLAGPAFVSIAGLIFAVIGWLAKKPIIFKLALLVLVTFLTVTVLKHIFRKARPNTAYARQMKFSKYSFPSGHAAVGLVLWYGAVLVLVHLGAPMWLVMITTALTPILVFLIGISRVYLGAHYLIDVLVGWMLGLAMMGIFVVMSIL